MDLTKNTELSSGKRVHVVLSISNSWDISSFIVVLPMVCAHACDFFVPEVVSLYPYVSGTYYMDASPLSKYFFSLFFFFVQFKFL